MAYQECPTTRWISELWPNLPRRLPNACQFFLAGGFDIYSVCLSGPFLHVLDKARSNAVVRLLLDVDASALPPIDAPRLAGWRFTDEERRP